MLIDFMGPNGKKACLIVSSLSSKLMLPTYTLKSNHPIRKLLRNGPGALLGDDSGQILSAKSVMVASSLENGASSHLSHNFNHTGQLAFVQNDFTLFFSLFTCTLVQGPAAFGLASVDLPSAANKK